MKMGELKMFQWIKNYIDKQVRKEVNDRVEKESNWRMKDIEDLQRRINLVMSEDFIDEDELNEALS